jgi:hypothetical protein
MGRVASGSGIGDFGPNANWLYRPVYWLEFLFPGFLDGVLAAAFSRKVNNLED